MSQIPESKSTEMPYKPPPVNPPVSPSLTA